MGQFPVEAPVLGPGTPLHSGCNSVLGHKALAEAHVPQQSFSEAEPLARSAAELERGVHHKRLQVQLERHLLHEVCVATAEGADRQDAELQRALKAPVPGRASMLSAFHNWHSSMFRQRYALSWLDMTHA